MTEFMTLEELMPLAGKVANALSRDYPEVEYDDLYQDLMEFVLKHRNKFIDDDQHNPTQLMWGAGKIFARAIRSQALTVSAQYAYRASDLRKLLEVVFQLEDWVKAVVPEDAKSEDRHDNVVMCSDVADAFQRLDKDSQAIIRKKYQLGLDFTPGTAERKRLDRAVRKLADILNSYRGRVSGKVGARRVVSNATARVMVDDGWSN